MLRNRLIAEQRRMARMKARQEQQQLQSQENVHVNGVLQNLNQEVQNDHSQGISAEDNSIHNLNQDVENYQLSETVECVNVLSNVVSESEPDIHHSKSDKLTACDVAVNSTVVPEIDNCPKSSLLLNVSSTCRNISVGHGLESSDNNSQNRAMSQPEEKLVLSDHSDNLTSSSAPEDMGEIVRNISEELAGEFAPRETQKETVINDGNDNLDTGEVAKNTMTDVITVFQEPMDVETDS